jgi:hypothetical protein
MPSSRVSLRLGRGVAAEGDGLEQQDAELLVPAQLLVARVGLVQGCQRVRVQQVAERVERRALDLAGAIPQALREPSDHARVVDRRVRPALGGATGSRPG